MDVAAATLGMEIAAVAAVAAVTTWGIMMVALVVQRVAPAAGLWVWPPSTSAAAATAAVRATAAVVAVAAAVHRYLKKTSCS
tara:strand:- start:140 stop:385 length:246 start_codon:yes stop_codon:yes gene_type:complete